MMCVSTLLACTSFIISGQATPSGKPMMFKHRDTGELNNRIAHFQGPKYTFVGLVNSPSLHGEVWAGMNSEGLCIMNTASYNLREDTLSCQMDREGELMFHVLGNCATIEDFEAWMQTYPQPWGVEANFGLIDAHGGAAYYEMNNSKWIKYDVNQSATGYRVVTNFSEAGRYEDYEGWERYQTATAIMRDRFSRDDEITAIEAIDLFSRQYKHEVLGVSYEPTHTPQYIADQDFIPRRITSAVIVFEGVAKNDNPAYTLMWSMLGYPACAVAVPIVMSDASHLPDYMVAKDMKKKNQDPTLLHSEMCDASLKIKNQWVFPLKISNGNKYVHIGNILQGAENKPSLLSCTKSTETLICKEFLPLYYQWVEGNVTQAEFLAKYDYLAQRWMNYFYESFAPYTQP